MIIDNNSGGALTITGGQATLGNVQFYPSETTYWPYANQWVYSAPTTFCCGETHVFACEHAETCKCGVARRAKPRICAKCGK
jgi:hypothetical protein